MPASRRAGRGVNKQWLNLSPRVGLAWDVTGDGRTAIRGSYGLTYDLPNGGIPVDQRELAAVRQPDARRRSSRRLRSSLRASRRGSASDSHEPRYAVHPVRRVRLRRSRHQFTSHPAVERDRRETTWTSLAGGSELSGQLYRSSVEPGRHQSRRVPRDRSVHAGRGLLSVLQHERESQSAARVLA